MFGYYQSCANKALGSLMEIYLGADERIISITCKNDKFDVTIKTPCENELYILEHNFPPRRCGQYGDENIR